jgi:diaminopimelate epimerase
MAIKFTKLQATGNDFVLIDARNMKQDWVKLAKDMCHRHFGIGSDGLILLLNSQIADFEMRMFNPDGSEAQVCGNGLRCFAKYVIDNEGYSKTEFSISTLAGIKMIQVFLSNGKVSKVKVNMGTPRFSAEAIPVRISQISYPVTEGKTIMDYPVKLPGRDLALSFVSMGNPHAVGFLSGAVKEFPIEDIGPLVENHILFPERINFEIARVLSRNKIEARVWERGAEETLACGSGACAIAVIARTIGYTGDEVDIMLPGGNLTVMWDGVGDVYLIGPVEEVFRGEWIKQSK